jgi:hypothetical protein
MTRVNRANPAKNRCELQFGEGYRWWVRVLWKNHYRRAMLLSVVYHVMQIVRVGIVYVISNLRRRTVLSCIIDKVPTFQLSTRQP